MRRRSHPCLACPLIRFEKLWPQPGRHVDAPQLLVKAVPPRRPHRVTRPVGDSDVALVRRQILPHFVRDSVLRRGVAPHPGLRHRLGKVADLAAKARLAAAAAVRRVVAVQAADSAEEC